MAGELADRKRAQQADHAREMAKLVEHPSWPLLRETFAKAREQAERKMARELLGGGEGHPQIDQRAVDYRRGFLRGCQAVLDHPELAVTMFEKADERTRNSE